MIAWLSYVGVATVLLGLLFWIRDWRSKTESLLTEIKDNHLHTIEANTGQQVHETKELRNDIRSLTQAIINEKR